MCFGGLLVACTERPVALVLLLPGAGVRVGFFLAISLPRRGTVTEKDRKVKEGNCGRIEHGNWKLGLE